MGLKPDFWSGRTVLLTGHTGFKGAWLSFWLQKLGAKVIGLSLNPQTQPNLFKLLDPPTEDLRLDLRQPGHLPQLMAKYQPSIVIHMAAQALVRESYQDPVGTFATNVMGTLNLLESLRQAESVAASLIITTDKCYRNEETGQAFRETDPLGGDDPYSASKACTEILSWSYQRSFFADGPALATARAGNVIGGGDWSADRLLPDMARAIFENKPLLIRNPHSVRPWQHVLEPLYGYLVLLQNLTEQRQDFSQPWNFGPAPEACVPVHTLVQELLGSDPRIQLGSEGAELHEAKLLLLDSSKADQKLNWQTRLNWQQTLNWTWSWYQAYYAGQNIKAFTLQQIEDYQQLCT